MSIGVWFLHAFCQNIYFNIDRFSWSTFKTSKENEPTWVTDRPRVWAVFFKQCWMRLITIMNMKLSSSSVSVLSTYGINSDLHKWWTDSHGSLMPFLDWSDLIFYLSNVLLYIFYRNTEVQASRSLQYRFVGKHKQQNCNLIKHLRVSGKTCSENSDYMIFKSMNPASVAFFAKNFQFHYMTTAYSEIIVAFNQIKSILFP